MDLERTVSSHYARPDLERVIVDALSANGTPPEAITAERLSPMDEFHLGFRTATARLASALDLTAQHRVVDLGAGIGGPARHLAQAYGCTVTGIDLTADYVEAGNALSRRCGLADKVQLVEGSALDLPFDNGAFDRAVLIHVGMNIADKPRLFAEAHRVLSPGGRFAVYDVMRRRSGAALAYPMPWAATEEASFVEPPETYRATLGAAGFTVDREEDFSPLVLSMVAAMQEKVAAEGPPALGLHIIVGPSFKERFGNVVAALRAGEIAPTLMIAAKA